MPNTKAVGVAYSDPQFDSVSVTGSIYAGQGIYGPTYTFATLPSASSVAAGTQLWTSNSGLMVSNGSTWTRVDNQTVQNALTTVMVGNSIAAPNQYAYAGIATWDPRGEIIIANALAEAPLKFRRLTAASSTTASTRCDAFGVYAYSGATLATINSDLDAQLWTPLITAGVIPDIIVCPDLLANDIGTEGASTATCILRINQFITDVQNRFPGVILLIATPHPSTSYNTEAKVTTYQQMVSYLQSIDNGVDIFVTTVNAYENPLLPGIPLSGYTDGVHPNSKGALLLARSFAATLRRVVAAPKQSYYSVSANMSLAGSTAANSPATGTMPTGCSTTGLNGATGSYVSLAENPWWTITFTLTPAGSMIDTGTATLGTATISGTATTQLSPFCQLEIVSGAENIKNLRFFTRYGNATVLANESYITTTTGSDDPDYRNGDVLTYRVPPRMTADFPTITGTNYTRFIGAWGIYGKPTGGTAVVRVRSIGTGIVVA